MTTTTRFSRRDYENAWHILVWYDDFEKTLPNMTGKRVAITGTTTGTGYIAAVACARKGAEVILLNRDSQRAVDAERKLREECPGAKIHCVTCDLTDFTSVRTAAKSLISLCSQPDGLDVLCCNAGVMAFPDRSTADGFDVQMQTNHLSHFLLVKEMLPALRAAAKAKGEARIVNHSSGARFGGPLAEKYFQKKGGDLGGDALGACFERYHQTKLANAVFTFALADKLSANGESNIKSLCCTPGIAATDLITNLEDSGTSMGFMRCMFSCLAPLMIQSAADGTMPLLTAIAAPDVQSGDLYTPSKGGLRDPREAYGPVKISRRPMQPAEKNAVLEDDAAQQMLWRESESAIGAPFSV